MEDKYIPSGVARSASIIKTLLLGIVAALILPILYIFLGQLIPSVYFSFLLAILLGLGISIAIDKGIKIGKIRNPKIAIFLAFVSALLATYTQWVYFDEYVYNYDIYSLDSSSEDLKLLVKNILYLFTHPVSLWNEIVALNEVGTFSIDKGEPITGSILWVIWAFEFLIILVSSILFVKNGIVSEPYSEVDNCWMTKKTVRLIPYVNDKKGLIGDLDRKIFTDINKEVDKTDDLDAYAELIVHSSESDPTQYITINNYKIKKKKFGKDELQEKRIIKYYPVQKSSLTI